MAKKPPLGLTPKKFWISKRIKDIQEAASRFEKDGIEVPNEWYIEYYELMAELLKMERK